MIAFDVVFVDPVSNVRKAHLPKIRHGRITSAAAEAINNNFRVARQVGQLWWVAQ